MAIASPAGGVVRRVLVTEGEFVEAGALLAEIQSPELALEAEQARRRVEFFRAQLSLSREAADAPGRNVLEEEVRRARGAEQAARRRLQEFSPRAVEQAAAEADRRRRRLEELFEQRLATRAEVEQAGAAARLEARNLQQAREHRSRLQQELASAEADLRVASLRRDDAASSSQRRPMLDLAEAESAYRLVKERLAGLRMSAPFPGTVLTAPEAGQQAWAGAPFFTLADLSYLELVAPVAATVAHTIAPGAAVTALLPTDPPSAVEAKVESVTYLPDREKASYTLRVIVPNPDPDVILAGLEGAIEYRHHER